MSIEIFDKASINALIDAFIVFALTMITELIGFAGIPTPLAIYQALLVSALAFLVFWAKKRGIDSVKGV